MRTGTDTGTTGTRLMSTIKHETLIRGIKLLDLGYIGAGHFLAGFALSRIIDSLFGSFDADAEKKKSTIFIVCEIILLLWMNSIIFYAVKNILELVPSPFNGIAGFDHNRVKELHSAPLLAFSLLYYQTRLQSKLKALYERFNTPGHDNEKIVAI